MATRASGRFEVRMVPLELNDKTADAMLGRSAIYKQFNGDLEATSQGEMLTANTTVEGSAVYSAIERVNGTLQERSGTFILQHNGVMTRGTPQLIINVVPDSGTGQLVGLVGKMEIKIAEGEHFYELEYNLPETP